MELRHRGLESGKSPHARRTRMPFADVMAHSRQPYGHNLFSGLVEWWPLSEAQGTRQGVHAAQNFASNNGVTQAAGPSSAFLAASFSAASTQYLTAPDTGGIFSLGNTDWSIVIWPYYNNAAGAGGRLLYKGNDAFTRVNYFIYTNTPNWQYGFSDGAGTFKQGALAFSPNVWQMLCLQHNATADTIGLSLNAAAFVTTATAGVTPYTGSEDLKVAELSPSVSRPFNGRAMRVGIWRRLLTVNELALLYRGGVGLDYPFYV